MMNIQININIKNNAILMNNALIWRIISISLILVFLSGVGSAEEKQGKITIGVPIDPHAQYMSSAERGEHEIITWNQPIDEGILPYPVMQFSKEELDSRMRSYTQKAGVDLTSLSGSIQPADDTSEMRYVSLLSSLPYDPALRDQGSCGNCWVFASIASIELQMAAQEMPDRISVQAFHSGWTGPDAFVNSKSTWFACNGGTPDWLVEYYLDGHTLIPWSNNGAAFVDASCTSAHCKSAQISYADIEKIPAYTIESLTNDRVITTNLPSKDASAQIRALIDNDIPVLLALFLPHAEAWQDFYTFWERGDERYHAFDITRYAGNSWNYAQGGGHQVLVTGYYDDGERGYFECLNSWGASDNRPHGTFLIEMNVDYNSAYKNNILAQMFEVITIDIGEYIKAEKEERGPIMNLLRPGIIRE
ncbi:MAG: hypothetical protein LBV40_08295 [Methanomicrobiales archaeon]|jgi:hypothetical protein|nr:hypothetical protein [Methanomicrobiales archaeon]